MALGILVPIVVVAIGIFPFSHVINERSWQLMSANDIARTQLERVRGMDFDSIPASSSIAETRRNTEFTGTVTAAAQGVQGTVILKKITVTVTWQGSRTETLRLDTLVMKPAS